MEGYVLLVLALCGICAMCGNLHPRHGDADAVSDTADIIGQKLQQHAINNS